MRYADDETIPVGFWWTLGFEVGLGAEASGPLGLNECFADLSREKEQVQYLPRALPLSREYSHFHNCQHWSFLLFPGPLFRRHSMGNITLFSSVSSTDSLP